MRPFGGVRQDVSCIKKAASGEVACTPCSKSEQYRLTALSLFCAADLPFSLIGDVVTWPYTATYCYINQPTPSPPVTQAPS
ncbi:MAG TPA: YceK/YidQ family lipoprotein, partial [Nitrospira sp.]|nr:YceK/YidQ family lipoprotein [Nitrospira sp.]